MTIKRKTLFWKLYPSFLSISFISLLAIVMIALWSFKSFYYQERALDLEIRAKILAPEFSRLIQAKRYPEIQNKAQQLGDDSFTRITIILPSGLVLGDNKKSPKIMDNHIGRPEIEQALMTGKGLAIRYSDTISTDAMNFAMPIIEQDILIGFIRTSTPLDTLQNALWIIYYKISIGFIILTVITVFASWWMSKSLVRPLEMIKIQAQRLAKGDFSSRVQLGSNDSLESEQLGQAFNEIAIELNQRIETILNQRNEQEAVFSSMVEGVVAVDSNEKIISINQAAYNILKIREKNIEGCKLKNTIDNSELYNLIVFSLQQSSPVGQEIIIHNENTHEQVLFAQSAPLLDIHKNKCGTLVVFNDITKLKEFELQRKEFVANVSHELRTPLTAIQGLSETLIEFPELDQEKRCYFIGVIHTHSIRLEGIIENLLTLSKIEKETEVDEIDFVDESVTLAISNAIFLCKDKALKRNINIILNNAEDISFKHNSSLIEQAIINLLNNAIKYSNGNSEINITIIKENNDIKINVADQGSGIPEEHLSRLFERFYRVDKARSRQLGGTGLGLSIVKHIALAHKGTVSVTSELNKGSVFSLILPLNNEG
ncbi:ATP-binding protein [Colwellia sp. 4_MG-2023]|uniref:sensor histidine kinase n=1 Tax=unclassified Colwellia TaxID=196834 RepID=UPI0026E1F602|nr:MULTISPECIES: ATP-binding protein [unclassified Colwellia]MDO6508594.1 ATP-binding protein [Colwellia sp. 5_MG-2023]MDO6557277.1 ATP-binding protein [Colwellia sp. 4_MG-2023]